MPPVDTSAKGFDDSRLDTLFLALPISWRGTLQKYIGRLRLLHTGKTEVRVHDYIGGAVPMLSRMFDMRRRGYEAVGYTIREDSSPLGSTPKRFECSLPFRLKGDRY